ncbi:hypothetical protein M1271_03175 [Patescibacteria group bacterium]|nr:hypothetical protein [Patescibacteria group bacterium]
MKYIKEKNKLIPHDVFLIVFLVIQYLLGMFTNLFVQFPQNTGERQMWEFAWSQPPLALHILVGTGLLLGLTVLVVRSVRYKDANWIKVSVVGTLAILIAEVAGAVFVPSQSDTYSFIMAVCFIITLLAFGWGVYKNK